MIDRLARGLLRRHVFGGADDTAVGRVPGRAEELRDAEVGQFDRGKGLVVDRLGGGRRGVTLDGCIRHGDQQVRRLQVTVDDAVIVGHLERSGDRQRGGDGFPPGKPPAGPQDLFEALATHQFHREIGLAVLLAEREQLHDPGMPEALEGVNLRGEPLSQAAVVGEVRREHLHGHRRSGAGVGRLVHGSHAATAEPRAECIGAHLRRLHARRIGRSTALPQPSYG